jgi:hypothetical protein
MRFRFVSAAAVVLAAFAMPGSLHAQFQPPTSEELKMTEEPKAPGAAAIYLYREETTDDNLHYHSLYVRIKVLTEKGKELATVGVPYPKGKFQITDIKARTIHADGTVIPLDVKPADLLMALNGRSNGGQINKMVFTLPSVEVGSILEYRWQLRYDDDLVSSPTWDIQQPYYVRKAHYSFMPFKYLYRITDNKGNSSSRLMYSYNLPTGAKVDEQTAQFRYVLDVADIEPTPQEDYMPPLETLLEHVQFYYTPYLSGEEFWKHEGGNWSRQMDHFAGESKTLKDAVSQIVDPADSQSVKANKLYDAVMALDNTDYTRRRSKEELKVEGLKQIKSAEDVWKQKNGTSDEIALLYLTMARIAGLKAYAVTVCDRNRTVFNPYYLTFQQFDDILVIVTLDGKDQALDPGERYTPFGQLGWKHTMTGGIRQSDKGPEFIQIPGNSYKEATTLRIADVQIASDGAVSGTARIALAGPEAVRWRQIALENDPDEVKRQFNEYLRSQVPEGVDAEFDHFLGLNDYHSQLMGIVKLSGNFGTVTGKRVFLPGVFFESRAKHPFVEQKTRLTSVDMRYASIVQDNVTYHLPDNFTVESSPAETSIPWTGKAVFHLKSTAAGNKVEVTRSLSRAFTMVKPAEYTALHDFYQKVSTADQQQLVLVATKPASTAGTGK